MSEKIMILAVPSLKFMFTFHLNSNLQSSSIRPATLQCPIGSALTKEKGAPVAARSNNNFYPSVCAPGTKCLCSSGNFDFKYSIYTSIERYELVLSNDGKFLFKI